MAAVSVLMVLLPAVWACTPQKADYIMISCFPNTIIANLPECPYGWEIEHLSLGGLCYSGVHILGYYRFAIPDLTPKNHSYCGTFSEYLGGKDPKYVFFNSIVSNDTSLTIRNQPVNYTFSCTYRAAYLVNNAVFSQRVATVYVNNGSIGSFKSQLSMNVFTNSKYLYTKDAPYVIDTSEIGSEVFIGIEAKGLSTSVDNKGIDLAVPILLEGTIGMEFTHLSILFKLVITNCWATPSPYSTDRKRWSLIINSCSTDNTVVIFENAKDSKSLFKFHSFRFQRLEKVSTVWLHCEVHICDSEKLHCQPAPCTARHATLESDASGGILTTEFQIKAEGSSGHRHHTGIWLCLLSLLVVNALLGCLHLPNA